MARQGAADGPRKLSGEARALPDQSTLPDQSKRVFQITLLESVIAKHAAAIATHELLLRRMVEKQINRLAELRMQKLYLTNAQRAAAKAAAAVEPERCGKVIWEQGKSTSCVLPEGHTGEHCFA